MGNGITGSLLEVQTDSLTGSNSIDSLLALSQWSLGTNNRTITYSFPNPGSWTRLYSGEMEYRSLQALNAVQQAQVTRALASWANVANITFTQVEDNATQAGDLRFAISTGINQRVSSGHSYYPSSVAAGGDVWMARDLGDATVGSFYFQSLIHEIGHALGLKHPGDYNVGGSSGDGPFLPDLTDNTAYSVMSYNDNQQLSIGTYLTGPSLYDIQAIQHLYGANMAAAPGNDTYVLGIAFQTIWDTNGSNTLDGSALTGNQILDLRAGNFSFNDTTLSAALAYGSRIQTARGGIGTDTIYANDLGDAIDGGAGSDTVVFAGASSAYTVVGAGNWLWISQGATNWTLSNVESLRFADRTLAAGSVRLDSLAYLAANPDLLRAGITTQSAEAHYAAYGRAENRSISFDYASYLAANPDLLRAGITSAQGAELHYVSNGYRENRTTGFDALGYIAANPDLIRAGITSAAAGVQHYLTYGYRENRTTGFNATGYLNANADLRAAGITTATAAEQHYISFGYAEGRRFSAAAGMLAAPGIG